jgi:anthranilate/para-aminobenzoate synthase component II
MRLNVYWLKLIAICDWIMIELTFATLSLNQIDEICELEASSYPEDEAASRDNIKLRLQKASNLFLGVFLNKQLIGFCNGTRVKGKELTHESMASHDPDGGKFIYSDLKRDFVYS